jgi:hypothetical protein
MTTMKGIARCVCCLALALAAPRVSSAGGAWVPAPGDGDIDLGYSPKTASTSWDTHGRAYTNRNGAGEISYQDFRYLYLDGEIGLFKNFSATFLMTYLDGIEGPHNNGEEDSGPSDAWFGCKYALTQGKLPMAIAFTYRTPIFYALPGPYSRELFDAHGNHIGESPSWRGLLKNDYGLTYLISQSAFGGGWWNFQTGYIWRSGAPSDQIPVLVDLGYPLPLFGSFAKLAGSWYHSVGNWTTPQPNDRFGVSATNNFNDASYLQLAASWLVPFGRHREYFVEGGYGQVVWGISARRYREPFISIDRRF